MDVWFKGIALTIWLRDGCRESWERADDQVPGQRKPCVAQLIARLNLLAEKGRLRSPDHMRHEGDGIYAVKARCGLRAYGWFCNFDGRRAYVISHVVLKKQQKARPSDLAKARAERDLLDTECTDRTNGAKR